MNRNRGFFVFIALLAVLFVLADIFLWINVANEYENREQLRTAYMDHYPMQVRNLQGLIVLPLILLAFASLFFIRSAKSNFFKMEAATLAALLALFLIWKIYAVY